MLLGMRVVEEVLIIIVLNVLHIAFVNTSNGNRYNIFDDQLAQIDTENNPIQLVERT